MIPIAKPLLGEDETEAVKNVLESGYLAQGKEVEEFEREFHKLIGTKFAVATSNGTSALHMVLAALGIGRGDEVITTTFSFIATASCILMQHATPVFCDIDPKTYNIDPNQIEEKITEKTKAIIPVHLYGQPCDMGPILDIAEDHDLHVIEDCAQSHGAEYKMKNVGSFGIGCFSFYPTKNMTTGEGGMITTDNEEVLEKARMIRNHGQERRYFHPILGYNYRMTDICAAIGKIQLKKLDWFIKRRIMNSKYYNENIVNVEVEKPLVLDVAKHVFNQYTLGVKKRDNFLRCLEKNEIGYGIHYPIPIHKQPLFKEYNELKLPNAEKASNEVVSIPVHPSLTPQDLERVVDVINTYV